MWMFENNTQDSSGNSYDGSKVGNPTFVDGIYGKRAAALKLDGFDAVTVADENESYKAGLGLNPDEEITVMAWAKNHAFNASSWQQIIMKGSNDGGEREYQLRARKDDGEPEFAVFEQNETVHRVIQNEPLTNNEWHHLAGTYNGQDLKLYVDGEVEATKSVGSFTLNDQASAPDFAIGRLGPKDAEYYNGTIDQVRIYNRSLSDAEIASFVNSSCNSRQRTIECVNSPGLCNTSSYTGLGGYQRYHCNYGQYDDPGEPNSLQGANSSQVGTGVCCPKNQDAIWNGSQWQCTSNDECKPSDCLYNISNSEDAWFNSTSDGTSDACNSQVPDLNVNTNEQPQPERRSQACCYVPKDGRMGYFYKDGNVEVYG